MVLLGAAIAHTILLRCILAEQRPDSPLAIAVGRDHKGKISLFLYAAAVPLAFINEWIADLIYVTVALIWLVPDRRIEERVKPKFQAHLEEAVTDRSRTAAVGCPARS